VLNTGNTDVVTISEVPFASESVIVIVFVRKTVDERVVVLLTAPPSVPGVPDKVSFPDFMFYEVLKQGRKMEFNEVV
jgi:hypothetical protein